MSAPSIIPQPVSMQVLEGQFVLDHRTAIVSSKDTAEVAQYLQDALAPATGSRLKIATKGNGISLRVDKKLPPEAYKLKSTSDKVEIVGGSPAGVFYGVQTLRQLLPSDIFRKSKTTQTWTIPAVAIEDQPRFGWRGAHMDVSRHFMPKSFVMKFLDLMALHKLNVFHWHLTDDPGWRIEIKSHPKLTEIGSKGDWSEMYPSGATKSINQKAQGFYTQDDIREIVQYAADRFITVLPEIELPGHSDAAIRAYPNLGNKLDIAVAGGETKFMGTFDNVFNTSDSTIAFLKDVLTEVLDLFPSQFIHIGGDEVWKEPWKKSPAAQARMKAQGLKDEEELQSWFIKQFDDFLDSRGRRLIGWDEILEGGLAPGATVMSWRGMDGGIAAAKAGHDVVMTPGSHTYFDHYQGKFRDQEPRAIGGFTNVERAYSFEPIPDSLTPEEAKHVLGAQAQHWSEYMPQPSHMEYMAYPRLCALAEVVWSPKAARDYPSFKARLEQHVQRLAVLDVNFRPLDTNEPIPAAFWKSGETTETFATREWDITSFIKAAGAYEARYLFTGGAHRLDIEVAELLEDGKVIATDRHAGMSGGEEKANRYKFSVPAHKPGAKYTLRASIRSDGGNDSNGEIYIFPVKGT